MGDAIGGHYSAVVRNRANVLPGNFAYASGRSGLYAILKASGAKTVHYPNYICSAVPETIAAAGLDGRTYRIDNAFQIADQIEARPDEVILLVNYFGLSHLSVIQDVARFDPNSLIVDCSQAYFQPPYEALATFYSPRKFLPLPDGGLASTNLNLSSEPADDVMSVWRYQCLVKREGFGPEPSRQAYLEAEQSLERPDTTAMSALSRAIAESVDTDFIADRRRVNFQALAALLNDHNDLPLELGDAVPLCYPLMTAQAEALRKILIGRRVYPPKYWPDIDPQGAFEEKLFYETLFLPIDHRYNERDMKSIAETILENA